MVNKKGWIKVVEAFTAVLIILGVVLVFLNKGVIQKEDISEKVYDAEHSILREIELNQSLRDEIMNVGNETLPIDWDFFDNKNLTDVKNKINEKTPDYLKCEAKLCLLGQLCTIEKYSDRDIYAKSIAIATSQNVYSPRQLKLFCWVA